MMELGAVDAMAERLACAQDSGESLMVVAHDARNMVTALGLFCELLEEPGVLSAPYLHYARELKGVAATSGRLVERLTALQTSPHGGAAPERRAQESPREGNTMRGLSRGRREWAMLPALPIDNLAEELHSNRNLLAALAGLGVEVTVDAAEGALAVPLTGEDLTRLLVNLVKNAVEAMPGGGRIHFQLREMPLSSDGGRWLCLTVEDNGPGIPEEAMEAIFEPGYTTRSGSTNGRKARRGLGLAISRALVEAAGGRMTAVERARPGACLRIELPVR